MEMCVFTFFAEKHILVVLAGKFVFQFWWENAFLVLSEKCICKKIEFLVRK